MNAIDGLVKVIPLMLPTFENKQSWITIRTVVTVPDLSTFTATSPAKTALDDALQSWANVSAECLLTHSFFLDIIAMNFDKFLMDQHDGHDAIALISSCTRAHLFMHNFSFQSNHASTFSWTTRVWRRTSLNKQWTDTKWRGLSTIWVCSGSIILGI